MLILGGMITIIGSSTNLLVSDSLKRYSDIEISFFEFSPWVNNSLFVG